MPPSTLGGELDLTGKLKSFYWRGLAALRVPGAHFTVHSEWDTLQAIGKRRASVARFGDGELMIMLGHGIHFQEYDPTLAKRLQAIIANGRPEFLVCLPPFDAMTVTKAPWQKRWRRYRRLFSYLVKDHGEYHSAAISRPAMVGNREPEEFYRALVSLWTDRHLVVVHHDDATARHPMFRMARKVSHLPCPPKHAFREYDSILQAASGYLSSPDVLFLVAAGPTAGVLAWDLANLGAQALDVGHLTSAYDDYMAKR